MIHESRYWKEPLLRAATWIDRLDVDSDDHEKQLARVEREVFIGFYAIRKLLPTFKLSDATKKMGIVLTWFPLKPAVVIDYFNRHEVDDCFQMDSPKTEVRDLEFVCNQIIHSYIFLVGVSEENKVDGFYVSSDRSKKGKLYFLSVQQLLHIFRAVGKDYPGQQKFDRNPVTGEWEAESR